MPILKPEPLILKRITLLMVLSTSLFLTGMALPAEATEHRVVVLPFTNSSNNKSLDSLEEGFSDLLMATLTNYEKINVVDREHLWKVINELGLSLSGIQAKEINRTGKLLQANRFVKGGFIEIKRRLNVNVHVFDVETSELLFSIKKTGDLKEVHELATALGEEVAHKLLSERPQKEPALIGKRPTVNVHYMKGLGAYHSGLFDLAVGEFMQVLDQDPAHVNARYWLGKSYWDGHNKDHARIEFELFLKDFPEDTRAPEIKKTISRL